MNIICTSYNPAICARNHCRVHLRKMIVEYAQLLSTAHHMLDGKEAIQGIYRVTHQSHPCSVWARESSGNYEWLLELLAHCLFLYEKDKGKEHKTQGVYKLLTTLPANIPIGKVTSRPVCMPEYLRGRSVTVSYKRYMNVKYKDWLSRKRPIKVEFVLSKPTWVRGVPLYPLKELP